MPTVSSLTKTKKKRERERKREKTREEQSIIPRTTSEQDLSEHKTMIGADAVDVDGIPMLFVSLLFLWFKKRKGGGAPTGR